MTTRILLTVVLVVVCTAPVQLMASDYVSGFGMTGLSCGKYLKDISTNKQAENVYDWWVAGFVTGINLEKGRIVSTDNPAHNAWIKLYCEAHPLEPFMRAAIELDKELDRKKQ